MNKPIGKGLIAEAKWVLLGQAGSAALRLASIRVVTEFLDLDAFGDAALILAGLVLAEGVFLSPVLAGQLRFDPAARHQGTVKELYAAVGSLGALGLLAASIGLAITIQFGGVLPGVGGSGWLMLVVTIWLASDAVVSAVISFLNATRQQAKLATVRIADGLARPALGIALILTLSSNALPYVGGRAAGASLVVLLLVAWGHRGVAAWRRTPASTATIRDWMGRLIRYGAPLVPLAGSQWVIHLADRYILEAFHGSAEVGVYAAAYGLASQPFIMVSASIALLLRPRMFESARDSELVEEYHARWLLWLVGIGGFGLLLLGVMHVPLGKVLLASPYRMGSGLFVIVGGGYLFLALGQSYEVLLLVEERTRLVLGASLISTVVSISTAMLLIPPFAALGAAWSTLLGLASYACATVLAVRTTRKAGHESG